MHVRQKLIILGGILVLVGSGCETSKSNGDQAPGARSNAEIRSEASATDRAETTSATTDSLSVILADTASKTR